MSGPTRAFVVVMLVHMLSYLHRLGWLGVLGAAAWGCSGESHPSADNSGTIVVGLASDLIAGVDIARLHVVMRADGKVIRDQVLKSSYNEQTLAFPTELRFDHLPGGTQVELALEVFQTHQSDEKPLMTRDAVTHVVSGRTLLLRARIEKECIPSIRLAGDLIAPTCVRPETCVAAQCTSPYVSPAALEEYSPTWADVFADACKPEDPGEPVVMIGDGEGTFRLLASGDIVQAEAGGQGGYHIWIAARMKNLHQNGSRTMVSVYPLDAPEPVGMATTLQSYRVTDDGHCELVGLFCQLAFYDEFDTQGLLGDSLRVVVKVADVTGDVGVSEQVITLSDNVIDP